MAQSSRQIQSQKLKQVQTLSPQQILVVRLLELPAVELEENIHKELLENPALEEGNDNSDESLAANDTVEGEGEENIEYDPVGDYATEDDIPDYKLQDGNRAYEEPTPEIPVADTTSFYEQLEDQLHELDLNDHQRELANYLIYSLEDDGLLRKPLTKIADELEFNFGITTSVHELEACLKLIQDFDPPGIGARTLQECLLLQLYRKEKNSLNRLETDIISKCYEDFTRKRWDKIKSKLNLTDEAFQEALADIIKLNPRPGSAMNEVLGRNLQQIVPDFIVDSFDEDNIAVSLNNHHIPELRVSRSYVDMLEEHAKDKTNRKGKEDILYIKQKVDAARNFIDAIRQRQATLLKTMQVIVDLQRPFFTEGDKSLLRPMILKDVAERAGLDISTVSRVSNSKYVETNFGIFPLKFFFNSSYVTDEGKELSVREIQKILTECIAGEDKTKPLTDEILTDILNQKGFPVARRTVAKYREQLNIPVARLRK